MKSFWWGQHLQSSMVEKQGKISYSGRRGKRLSEAEQMRALACRPTQKRNFRGNEEEGGSRPLQGGAPPKRVWVAGEGGGRGSGVWGVWQSCWGGGGGWVCVWEVKD